MLALALGIGVGLFSSVPAGETQSTVALDGLRLSGSINATRIKAGESLQIDISLFNTLPTTNSITTSDDWLFRGVPVALWPACYFSNSNLTAPAQAVILAGDYNLTELRTAASVGFSIMCHESTNIDHVVFQPTSSEANLTGTGFFPTSGTDGPYQLSIRYTTTGYWDMSNGSRQPQGNTLIIGGSPPSPACGDCAPAVPATIPFVAGEYTVAIADEWGQAVVLHFDVATS